MEEKKKIAALLGGGISLIASLIGVYVFATGNSSIQDIQRNGFWGAATDQQDIVTLDQSGAADPKVTFTDRTFELAIKSSLHLPLNEAVPMDIARSTSRLVLTENSINSLAGIESFTNLEVLILDPCYGQPPSARKEFFKQVSDEAVDVNNITDLTPLLSLSKLRTLVIFCNTCTDLQTIGKLSTLKHLRLSGQYIGYESGDYKDDKDAYVAANRGSLQNLTTLTNLETLDISHNYIVDFSALLQLPNLKRLNISSNGTKARPANLASLGDLSNRLVEVETKADWPLGAEDAQ